MNLKRRFGGIRIAGCLLLGFGALVATRAFAQFSPVPAELVDKSGVVCIRVGHNGDVTGVFTLVSVGDADADAALLGWAKQLRWPPAVDGDVSRDRWFPMPVAFGSALVPPMPDHCEPPEDFKPLS